MLAAATSFFARTNISQSYNIGGPSLTGSRSSTPGPSGPSTSAIPTATAHAPPFNVGPWRVQSATHKTTAKRVSVWSADKRSQEMDRMGPASRERTIEVLKTEVRRYAAGQKAITSDELTAWWYKASACLGCGIRVFWVVEPLEETRSELIFATEPVLSSLHLSVPGSFQYTPLVELDEVEIQKGILQVCKGLSFLHTSARTIHTNLTPESILINSAGDWKISGLGLTIPLSAPGGGPTRWEFPTFDGRVSPYTQRSFDYMAPEYALDEVLDPASDLYSLGCLISLRENAGKPLSGMERLDPDLRNRSRPEASPSRRPHRTTSAEQTIAWFPPSMRSSPHAISTLNFLDRSNFAAKTLEEKISFMKVSQASLQILEGLRTRKILPSLLEEMKDTQLLHIYCLIYSPSRRSYRTTSEHADAIGNLQMLQEKTEKPVFREHVLPLVYNALESEHAVVQERALRCVPDLCESIDYAEVQGVLFPRVALVFTKTRILSVKVATLQTFLAMVKTLDQTSLTQKLVPLLSKIRTKEPAVTMATLAVQEATGMKVDREAVATLVLPQLWGCPWVLSSGSWRSFVNSVIVSNGNMTTANGTGTPSLGGAVDFESLVSNGTAVSNGSLATVKADTVIDSSKNWEDDVWGSIFTTTLLPGFSPAISPPPAVMQPSQPSQPQTQSLPSSPRLSTTRINSAAKGTLNRQSRGLAPAQHRPSLSSGTMQAATPSFMSSQAPAPNYNISLTATPPLTSMSSPPLTSMGAPAMTMSTPPLFASSPSMSAPLVPSKPAQPSWSMPKQLTKDDWGDFDPLA
ncbi:uncharacterized protein B0H18DRAFT_1116681 [Fomitopsis serialis]|uniref:uncharacterized protein n=1 Tax=Fomitopsis serialis TaxID=139415 RepID=UPI0020076329|nr:uncharacterized protein B0H18DRAFT_1116681 [Neoantrodia serialis]KAH9930992.1 hypothetical protein B0H18DRAFT_1116681 [Neoantrodia serialis]